MLTVHSLWIPVMRHAVLGLSISALLIVTVWLSGRHKPNALPILTEPEAQAPATWEKVHDGGNFVIHRANTTPAAYLIAVGDRGIVIDCPDGLPTPFATVPSISSKGWSTVHAETILLTHHHRDSCGTGHSGDAVSHRMDTRAPKASAEWLEPKNVTKFWKESIPLRNSRTGYFVHPTGIDGIQYTLENGLSIDFHGVKIEVISTPGHSIDHVSFAVNDLIFLGDAMTGDGKLWTPFTTDWDHWTDIGLKASADSLRKLAARNPTKLFPARGPVVTVNPKTLLEDAAKKVDEAGFLKSFERFTNRRGNPPQYDFLVPKDQTESNGSKPWSKVSASLWVTGNTYVLKSNRSNRVMVIDPWATPNKADPDGLRSYKQIASLQAAEQLGPVEVVTFSHAHYDHFDGVYALPMKGEYQVWGLDQVAEPLESPFKFRLPFLDERPIKFNRILKDGESATWQEYEFKFHHFPGQSYFTAALECSIDGKRCLFTADNFFHQNMYSGSGGWMGLNRSSPLLYAASAKKVLAINPEWVLAEHGGPYVFNAEDYRRRVAWGLAAGKACDAICVSGNHRLDWNPHSAIVSPYKISGKAGTEIRSEVWANLVGVNPKVTMKTPWGVSILGNDRDSATNSVQYFQARSDTVFKTSMLQLTVPGDTPHGRHIIPILVRGPLGEVADPFLAVDVLR